MLDTVISGGQTGADQAGWRAAKRCGLPTSGWMPRGFLTENGPCPEFAEEYGAREMPTDSYAARTRANVEWASAILWYGSTWSAGAKATFDAARQFGKPTYVVADPGSADPPMVATWVGMQAPTTLMIAGNRASKATIRPDQIERHLEAVFALLGFPPTGGPGD